MFKNLRKAEGFTLIELIVVIAVLILLMAIALPSFLGVRNKAHAASAKSDLTVAIHDAKAEWADSTPESYGTEAEMVTALGIAEPGLNFEAAAAAPTAADYAVGTIDVDITAGVLTLATKANDGKFYEIVAGADGTVTPADEFTPAP